MKKIMFMIMMIAILTMATSCGSVEVKADGENVFNIETDSGDILTCSTKFKYDDGLVFEGKCVGFLEKDGNIYKCMVDIDSGGIPITKKIIIKENCEIDIKKKTEEPADGKIIENTIEDKKE